MVKGRKPFSGGLDACRHWLLKTGRVGSYQDGGADRSVRLRLRVEGLNAGHFRRGKTYAMAA